MVGDDVAGQLEPEFRDPVQDLPLVGDRRRHHDVVDRDPVGGDHQQVVLPLVDLPDLAGGVELQVCDRDRRHCARLYRASAMLFRWRFRQNRRSARCGRPLRWSVRPLRLPQSLPARPRRLVQPHLPRLRAADGDDLPPGGDQGALPRAEPRPSARPQHLPRADRRLALAAAARRRRPPREPEADAAGLPRRADAVAGADGDLDRRRRDRLLAAGTGVPAPSPHAVDHARGDPPGRVRRLRRARASSACATCSATS